MNLNIADAMLESDDDEEDEVVDFKWQAAGTRVFFKRDENDDDDIDIIGFESNRNANPKPCSSQSSPSRTFLEQARDEAIVREVSRDLGCCDLDGGMGKTKRKSVTTPIETDILPRGFDDDEEDFCVIEDVGRLCLLL